MDLLTLTGLLIGFGAIFGGYIGEGGSPAWVLWHPFAWIIVLGGSLGLSLIHI